MSFLRDAIKKIGKTVKRSGIVKIATFGANESKLATGLTRVARRAKQSGPLGALVAMGAGPVGQGFRAVKNPKAYAVESAAALAAGAGAAYALSATGTVSSTASSLGTRVTAAAKAQLVARAKKAATKSVVERMYDPGDVARAPELVADDRVTVAEKIYTLADRIYGRV